MAETRLLITQEDGQKNRKCDYKLSKSYTPILLWGKCLYGIPERCPQNHRVLQNTVWIPLL